MKDVLRHGWARFIVVDDPLIGITEPVRQSPWINGRLPIHPYSGVIRWSQAEILECYQNKISMNITWSSFRWLIIGVENPAHLSSIRSTPR